MNKIPKLPDMVYGIAIANAISKNKNWGVETNSLFEGLEERTNRYNYLYDLCDNIHMMYDFKGAYRNIKNTHDIVKAMLHLALMTYCNNNRLVIGNYLGELK